MSVAGSDSGAGAGIQADLLTFAAHGVYGCTAITALTAQNPDEVRAVHTPDAGFVRAELEAVSDYYRPAAAKTGMLSDAAVAREAADFFASRREILLVADTVMFSTSGARLLEKDAERVLEERLIPLSRVFTPNLDEARALLGGRLPKDPRAAACKLRDKFGAAVLLKGGHRAGDEIVDILADVSGEVFEFRGKRVRGVNTHGSGCTLSAAIAANLALGKPLPEACERARGYLVAGMKNPLETRGGKFINHFPKK